MPQTEEELQDRDDSDSNSSGSSSSTSSRRSSVHCNDLESLSSLELGADGRKRSGAGGFSSRKSGFRTDRTDTEHEDNDHRPGNVGKSAYFSSASIPARNSDDVDDDGVLINDFGSAHYGNFVAKKKTRPLKLRKKLYEFYAAPISKYWAHTIAYVAFLA